MRRMIGVIAALSCALLVFSILTWERPAEAKRPRWAWVPGGDQSAPLLGATTFGRQWDVYAAADTISAVTDAGVIGAWPYEPDGGTLPAAHTDGGLSAGYQPHADFFDVAARADDGRDGESDGDHEGIVS